MIRKIALLGMFGLACGGGESEAGRSGDQPEPPPAAAESSRPAVLFLGTSLTAGLGVDPDDAYPALIGRRIDSVGLPFRVVNAGVSGETSADGLRRIDWLLRQPVAVLVVELGANDALRGLMVDSMRANLQRIIDRTHARSPGAAVVIAGMQAPPNLGRAYTERFRRVFPDLARANHATLIPFLLDGVGGVPELNQADGIHPTVEGHRIVAANVWAVLEPLLRVRADSTGATPAGAPRARPLPDSARQPIARQSR